MRYQKCLSLLLAAVISAGLFVPAALAESSAAKDGEPSSSQTESVSGAGSSSETQSGAEKPDRKEEKEQNPTESTPLPQTSGVSPTLPPPAFADSLLSKNICMINLDSNTIIYEKNSQERIYPASLTKIMTCIIALEKVADLDNETTTLKSYINDFLYTNSVNTLGGIYTNEELCIRDLLYASMLQSANEAAMMVADYVGGGDIEYFCEMMNQKAKEIGAKNTNFSNPTGIFDENNYSTAYDLALITQYAMQNETFVDIVTTNQYTSNPTTRSPNGITWFGRNRMQQSSREEYYAGVRGVKTGTLAEQNLHNLSTTATRDGYNYLLVVCNAPLYREEDKAEYKDDIAAKDTALLYDWAFETFEVQNLMSIGKEVAQVGVRLAWEVDHIKLVAADKFSALVPKQTTADSIEYEIVYKNAQMVPVKGKKGETTPYIDAPVDKGQEVGYVKLMLGGQEVGRVRLVAGERVERSEWLYYVEKAKGFLGGVVFKFLISFVVIVGVLYILLMILRNHNRKRYQMRRRKPPNNRNKR